MIQFSLSYVEPSKFSTMTNTTNIIKEASIKANRIAEEVQNILRKSEGEMIFGENLHQKVNKNIWHYLLSCIWEVMFIGVLTGAQLFLFRNVLSKQSII